LFLAQVMTARRSSAGQLRGGIVLRLREGCYLSDIIARQHS